MFASSTNTLVTVTTFVKHSKVLEGGDKTLRVLLQNAANPRAAPFDAIYDRPDGVLMHHAEYTGNLLHGHVTCCCTHRSALFLDLYLDQSDI